MQIQINSVTTSFTNTAKGGYSTAVVVFTDPAGRAKTKKIQSFTNPKVFNTLKEALPGSIFEVTERQDGEYTNWADVVSSTAAPSTANGADNKTSPAPFKPEYETRDERNLRQRYIIKQSCLAQAVNAVKDTAFEMEEVLGIANKFVAWVTEAPELTDDLE